MPCTQKQQLRTYYYLKYLLPTTIQKQTQSTVIKHITLILCVKTYF
jgi:hypothetical protein